jgi:hypothetical protein
MINQDRVYLGGSGTYVDIAIKGNQYLSVNLSRASYIGTMLTVRFASRSKDGNFCELKNLKDRGVGDYRTLNKDHFKGQRLDKLYVPVTNGFLRSGPFVQFCLANDVFPKLAGWLTTVCEAEGFTMLPWLNETVQSMLDGTLALMIHQPHTLTLAFPALDALTKPYKAPVEAGQDVAADEGEEEEGDLD